MPDLPGQPNSSVVERLRRLLLDDLDVRLAAEDLDADSRLFQGGADLDSFAIIEFVSLIQTTFEFEFSEEDLRPEAFENLRSIATVVEACLRREADRGPGARRAGDGAVG